METCTIRAFLENAYAKKVRSETLDGRKYLVAPTAMITVGVHNGSHGPVFYSEGELGKTTTSWNMKPVVVYHPKVGKSGTATAADPLVIETSQIGILLNTGFDKKTGKLRTESWIDIDKANKVDPRIVAAIRKGKPMEVSTGMSADLIENVGTFGDKAYKLAATNIQPDHFAVLPDQIGACSIAAGAGLLVTNEEGGWDGEMGDLTVVVNRWLGDWEEQQTARADQVITNGLSFGQIAEMVRNTLRETFGKPGQSWYGMVLDLYEKKVVFEDGGGKLFVTNYSVTNDGAVLEGDPVPVKRLYQYADAKTGKVIQNEAPQPPKESDMDRKAHIDGLITNGVFAESDRKALEAMDESVLAKIKVPEKKTPEPVPAPAPVVTNKDEKKGPPTLAEYLETVPKEFRSLLTNGVNALAERKTALVEIITNAEGNVLTKEQLGAMDDSTLEAMAALVQPKQDTSSGLSPTAANYYGIQGGGPRGSITNKAEKPPALLAPSHKKPDATK